jgi:OOP family OmpA-OmpF porin
MTKRFSMYVIMALFIVVVAGCAAMQTMPPFTAPDYAAKIASGEYYNKVDNFEVIFDASSSMQDPYHGKAYGGYDKFSVEKDLVGRLNSSVPAIALKGALRSFGDEPCINAQQTRLDYGIDSYARDAFAKGLVGIKCANGGTPLNVGMDAASRDFRLLIGPIALIIFSDGLDISKQALVSVENLKNLYGERLCIYTVQVGTEMEGAEFLKRVADIGKCGFASQADTISSGEGMADFVEKVFLNRDKDSDGDGVWDRFDKCPGTPAGEKVDKNGCPYPKPAIVEGDADKDGVVDSLDKCPGTPTGAKVDRRGCWRLEVKFDTAKSVIKPVYHNELNDAANVLKKNPKAKVEIQGHTDNKGKEKYNMKLSQSRAKAVKAYFVKKGVSETRMTTKGYGASNPVETNDTEAGRAENRRMELKVLD